MSYWLWELVDDAISQLFFKRSIWARVNAELLFLYAGAVWCVVYIYCPKLIIYLKEFENAAISRD